MADIIRTEDERNPHYLCPTCGHRFEVPAAKPPCPNCGTRCYEGINNTKPPEPLRETSATDEEQKFETWCSTMDIDIQFDWKAHRYYYKETRVAWAAWQARAAKDCTPDALKQWAINCGCGCDACVELIETLRIPS